ncbi:sensor histidine kinase [Burkholderia gladioli]|uniref:sensor histidine kinase n=1 Tax=Burkholderia gladioli TaxID=28095 RepID=UPI0016400031|nr:HAMP domain-containing sensor histidine kinase [Burkholderia gladioli]
MSSYSCSFPADACEEVPPARAFATLADFIEARLPELLQDWAAARAAEDGRQHALRSLPHTGAELLRSLLADLRGEPGACCGEGPWPCQRSPAAPFRTAAGEHANARVRQGLGIETAIAELRALRFTVSRRWQGAAPPGAAAMDELIRFNDVVDRALDEVVRAESERAGRLLELVRDTLAHRLCAPLGAISHALHAISEEDDDHDGQGHPHRAREIVASADRATARMRASLDGLLALTRRRRHDALPLHCAPACLRALCEQAVGELRAGMPELDIELRLASRIEGRWDRERLGQLLRKLLSNAARHGRGRVVLEAHRDEGLVTLSVFSEGNPIPQRALPTLFDPLRQAPGPARGAGLGLYLCGCIVAAHGGTIRATSCAEGTTVAVVLPVSRTSTGP